MSQLRWNTAGESHGRALIGILEGLPLGLPLDVAGIDAELIRRQGGYGRGGRMKIETDRVEVLSGVRAGETIGSPLALSLINLDYKIDELPVPTNARPGHADLAGSQKFGRRDPRAVLERASARETAMRVALGGAARQVLEAFGVEIFGHLVELGGQPCSVPDPDALGTAERGRRRMNSEFYCLDDAADERLKALVDAAAADRDTLGGVFEVRTYGLLPGLGHFASGSERLTSKLAGALMSIPAMKGVEFGLGFESARLPGSGVHDPIRAAQAGEGEGRYARESNRSGGLEGGMTTGEPLVLRVAMKPISTLRRGVPTVDFESLEPMRATYQRSDVTAAPAASVVGEAMVALCLAEAFLAKFGGDSMSQVAQAVDAYRADLGKI